MEFSALLLSILFAIRHNFVLISVGKCKINLCYRD